MGEPNTIQIEINGPTGSIENFATRVLLEKKTAEELSKTAKGEECIKKGGNIYFDNFVKGVKHCDIIEFPSYDKTVIKFAPEEAGCSCELPSKYGFDTKRMTEKVYEASFKAGVSLFENLFCADHPGHGFCRSLSNVKNKVLIR